MREISRAEPRRLMRLIGVAACATTTVALAAIWFGAVNAPLVCPAFGSCSTLEARAAVAAVGSAVLVLLLAATLVAVFRLPAYAAAIPQIGTAAA